MTNEYESGNIFSQVEQIVRQQTESDTELTPETDLLNNLGIDSLELVELGLVIEKAFRITLPLAELRSCITVGELAQLVQQVTLKDQVPSA